MKRKWIRLLTPLAVVLGIAMALPFMSSAVDLSRKCSLSVSLTNNPEMQEDLAEAKVVIDVYQVARAIPQKSGGLTYDAYDFEALGAYTNLALTDDSSKEGWGDWQAVAQEAAGIVMEGTEDGAAVPASLGWIGTFEGTGASDYAISDLEAGLYLLIARGEGLEREEYLTTLTETTMDEALGIEKKEGSIATVAYSGEYAYTFLPELVALPNKEATPGNLAGSADAGDWIYDFAIFMKPGRDVRYGSLEIVKDVLTYETMEDIDDDPDQAGTQELATFVFGVEAVLGEKTVYSNVVSLTFDAPGQKKILIEKKIPVGAEVTVTELYSGSSYTMVSGPDWSTPNIISATDLASVSFTNDYDKQRKSGHGIINHFQPEMDASGQWIYNWISAGDTLQLPVTAQAADQGGQGGGTAQEPEQGGNPAGDDQGQTEPVAEGGQTGGGTQQGSEAMTEPEQNPAE